jgi:LysR family transcriptional regulator, transcriptional activator for leuABCD operon
VIDRSIITKQEALFMLSKKDSTISVPNLDATINVRMESTLRGVDLNLLTVFDAVMQEQNITRAAHNLGMSQPAVSNAVARLKVMFNDELFMRQGRGISPTQRAKQLFGPIRQALQLIRNELPTSLFLPETSSRQFNLAICSPNDVRFAPKILARIYSEAPSIQLHIEAEHSQSLAESLRYQEVDFVIDYDSFSEPGFCSIALFSDELVAVASKSHPRIQGEMTVGMLESEKHAKLSAVNGRRSLCEQVYKEIDCQTFYEGTSLSNLLYVVSQSQMVTIAPRSLVENVPMREQLQILALPHSKSTITGYLNWHESSEKDKGHHWLKEQLVMICSE